MSKLAVAILGLGRSGASVGLALRRYMKKGGKHLFDIVGYDVSSDAEKQAQKMGAIDRIEHRVSEAVAGRDIIVLALPADELKAAYKTSASAARDGTVILDLATLKRPSLAWAAELLRPDQHVIGLTPVLNPRYLFDNNVTTENAQEDLFDQATMLLTPAPSSAKEAVDLAFNFCAILGSPARFLDPLEHDALLTFTEGLPALLGVALFQTLLHNPGRGDMQRFTGSAFGVLTRPLHDLHPDALRDEWLANRDILSRALEDFIRTLQTMHTLIQQGDRAGIEALTGSAAEAYEVWVNHRFNDDWDKEKRPDINLGQTMMGSLLGNRLSDRLFGKNDNEKQ
ncbi:MAG: prephenate dehydrogenase/arogenate dehydrogenase family protein [Anaerolineae bacterium]|jgi:prephenate dehydrogenase|nr:prephenate dehydrogenase/arogenate dehydrogenase family protein [Anaerolineae bacterium]